MFDGIFKLYGKLDPETTKLFGRFVAKCVSMENPNLYLKNLLRKELDNGSQETVRKVEEGVLQATGEELHPVSTGREGV